MSYVSPIQDLLREQRLPALRPGTPAEAFRKTLQAHTLDTAFAPAKVVDRDSAQACMAGLWLYFDFLDESHGISQDLDTPDGSYWHAILHRREPDYSNAKYWFRRVGNHPVFESLRQAAAELTRAAGTPRGSEFLVEQKAWDAFAFVDLCEAASRGRADEMLCRQIQQREWKLLFEYCYRRAIDS
jgi:hypothetical protein